MDTVEKGRRVSSHRHRRAAAVTAVVSLLAVCAPSTCVLAAVGGTRAPGAPQRTSTTERTGTSLESAAARAGDTGRAVAMSLLGLAFAVAATVLAFRRDFKEAAGVFAVGIVAVLLATPTGVSLLRDTVASLFGAP